MMSERILTRHPEGKQGVRIDRRRYEQVRETILGALEGGEMTFTDLVANAGRALRGRFEGSVPWYVTTVKLDLEARGAIERVPGSRPQRLRIRRGGARP